MLEKRMIFARSFSEHICRAPIVCTLDLTVYAGWTLGISIYMMNIKQREREWKERCLFTKGKAYVALLLKWVCRWLSATESSSFRTYTESNISEDGVTNQSDKWIDTSCLCKIWHKHSNWNTFLLMHHKTTIMTQLHESRFHVLMDFYNQSLLFTCCTVSPLRCRAATKYIKLINKENTPSAVRTEGKWS